MQVIRVRNVNDALILGTQLLRDGGVWRESRAGRVIEYPEPVTTVYEKPYERLLFSPARDANPFFHFMEALWMLDGRNDVKSISYYVKRMETFSDDGETLHGAYGYRWRNYFIQDQILNVINRLKTSPEDRRVVLGMWDPAGDFYMGESDARDVPCNTHIYFKIRDKNLHMTVCCRSNDMIWGAYGANAVHMSMLQEFIAYSVGVGIGRYTQISDSFHAYEDVYTKVEQEQPDIDVFNSSSLILGGRYNTQSVSSDGPGMIQEFTDHEQWLEILNGFLADAFIRNEEHKEEHYTADYDDPYFDLVAEPIAKAYWEHKNGHTRKAIETVSMCVASDWRVACTEWLERRLLSDN